MAETIRVDWEYMADARRMYRKLVRQLEEGRRPHNDILHVAYKVGEFLDTATNGAFRASEDRAPDVIPDR